MILNCDNWQLEKVFNQGINKSLDKPELMNQTTSMSISSAGSHCLLAVQVHLVQVSLHICFMGELLYVILKEGHYGQQKFPWIFLNA